VRGILLWACAVSMAAACGGAADSPLLDGGTSGGDGGSSSDGGGGDASQTCGTSQCPAVPDGFELVRLASDGTCPSGWSAASLVTSPTAGDGACGCGCNVTPPDCNGSGNVTRELDYSSTPTCNYAATTFLGTQGACSPVDDLVLQGYHYQTNPLAPTGGSCTYQTTIDKTKLGSTPATVCSPPANCPGAVCGGDVCLAKDGDVDCPAPFSTKTLVGTAADAQCSDCSTASCTLSATCTGTFKVFTDTQCTQGEVDFTADGTCTAVPTSDIGPYDSYSYTGSVASATCGGPAPTSTATATLDGPKTICCK